MRNYFTMPRSILSFLKITGHASLMMLLFAAVPNESFAQSTSGTIRGYVQTPSAEPAVGAIVTVTDTRTNSSRTTTVNENGAFNLGGLAIGGPFTIAVESLNYKDALVTDVFTNLSAAVSFNIDLEAGVIEEVIVTGSAVLASMPASSNARLFATSMWPEIWEATTGCSVET